ncbi:MAG: aminopeptidase [Candidatus Woesearchaeota archaeon]
MASSTGLSLRKAADMILRQCMSLKKSESLLVITDKNKKRIAGAVYEAAFPLCRNVMMVTIPAAKVNGEEPPAIVADMMKGYDVIIAPTTKSMTHTMAVKKARKSGARVATMPGITEDVLKRGMSADYRKVKRLSEKINSALQECGSIRVTTRKGTDITICRDEKVNARADSGFVHERGGLANLPAGESVIVPKHRKTEGVFVVDASMGGIGKVDRPITITVKKGYAERIKGGKSAAQLRKKLEGCAEESGDDSPYNIAELGIGTNYKAKVSGTVLEDEKVFGTAHIALGNSKGLGGKIYAPCHLDGVFMKPTIMADDRTIMKDGKLLI